MAQNQMDEEQMTTFDRDDRPLAISNINFIHLTQVAVLAATTKKAKSKVWLVTTKCITIIQV